MAVERYLGVDFSGGAGPWRANAPPRARTVWIATVHGRWLADLRPVQDLEGEGQPFERLRRLLGRGDFRAAGIDAPFSIPARHVPPGGRDAFLRRVAAMPAAADRPFPRGQQLVDLAASIASLDRKKPLRETERACGALARSTLWNGARGGAAFTAACLYLIAQARAPVWPWSDATGMLVEAFPMAQLKAWNLPWKAYAGADQAAARAVIIDGLAERIAIADGFREIMLASPDALDAVAASFGARAAATGGLLHEPSSGWRKEGAIAVHR